MAVLAYTGGTTGSPKGAMLTHANLTAACSLYREVLFRSEENTLREGEERFLCILPMFHIYSLVVVMLLGFSMGSELIVHPRFDPAAAARDIGRKKITVYMGVPTMHVAILSLPEVGRHGFLVASLMRLGRGAPAGRGQGAVGQRRGLRDLRGLGNDGDVADRHVHAARGPIQARLLRDPLPRHAHETRRRRRPDPRSRLGERGEICVKGPNIMKGYWKNPEETANSMTADGFFRTGDVGTMDEDGYVYIVDRTKDMLLVRRVQRLSAQHRGGDLSAPLGRGSERHRNSGRLSRRDAESLRQVEGRRA